MRSARLGFAIALVITALTPGVPAQTSEVLRQKANMIPSHDVANQAPPQARQNETAVEKKIFTAAPSDPEQDFRKPQESFPKEALRAAAAEFHNGAAWLRFQAGRVADKTEEGITASRRKLEQVGQRVKESSTTLTRALRRTLARAAYR